MALIIPLGDTPTSANSLPLFNIQAVLEAGVTYTIRPYWNVRGNRWYFDVLDAQSINVLIASVPFSPGVGLTFRITGRQPPGDFRAFDTSLTGTPPAFGDLGGRVQLVYQFTTEL